MIARTASTARCAAVWTIATAAAALAARLLVSVLSEAGGALTAPEPPFDRLLLLVCAGAALVAVAWLWLVTSIVVVEALRGLPRPVPGVPGPLRRLVLTACGVAVLAGLAGPAHASTAEDHRDHTPQTAAVVIAGLPLPDRAVAPKRPAVEVVEVAPGDTLWAIAQRELGPTADDAAITARWHEIYELNRAVIGADPDLIRPAQRLRLPTG
ncbi:MULTISPECIES: LysM peptidoglycan-binding domain-containing protein [unclassified Nocardioides]|uniref:LysM peptidoglycan-binding domain-containing protein n=1 Tax=unclassified Nocardioides TaxID=2615069 RepID=UPI0009F09D62|nr:MULTISPECIES: LysM peptidoglycan-binding domain-containing protein [unclassified Nocardioides]GAW50416.1 uncharacterized protein (Precursor) [Nocardioides sp. PD653-B2]GAW55843.1 uncharacterized protein (Precursor) [Nocardioides sp. PD653]